MQTIWEGLQADVIYTNLSAAFDNLNHAIVIAKLQKLGLGGCLLEVFRSYIFWSSIYSHRRRRALQNISWSSKLVGRTIARTSQVKDLGRRDTPRALLVAKSTPRIDCNVFLEQINLYVQQLGLRNKNTLRIPFRRSYYSSNNGIVRMHRLFNQVPILFVRLPHLSTGCADAFRLASRT